VTRAKEGERYDQKSGGSCRVCYGRFALRSRLLHKSFFAFHKQIYPAKWVGVAIQAKDIILTPDMLAYMEANHWGLWLETPPLWAGASDYSGNNKVNTSLTEFKMEVGPLLTNIQNNYHIPVMINLAEITDRWSWGAT
jgi:hypothetical protein